MIDRWRRDSGGERETEDKYTIISIIGKMQEEKLSGATRQNDWVEYLGKDV